MISNDDIRNKFSRYINSHMTKILHTSRAEEYIPEFEGKGRIDVSHQVVTVRFPWNNDFQSAMDTAVDSGWSLVREYSMPNIGEHAYIYAHPEVKEVELWLKKDSFLDGSTCERKVVGYENKPIYVVDCMEVE